MATKIPDPRGKPPKDGGKWPENYDGDATRRYWDTEKREYVYPDSSKKPTQWDPRKEPYGPDSDDQQDAARYTSFTDRHGETQMSNKFLPFVVENSTPLHMFKTLMSRSKGMNQVLIASTFNLILSVDIKILRKRVKELPEMPLEKIYEELLIKYPMHRVTDEVLATYQNIVQFFPNDCEPWASELTEYSENDVMLFFCSMAYAGKPSGVYTDFPYNLIMEGNSSDDVLADISKHVKFSDKGKKIIFNTAAELRCFVLYHGLFRNMMEPDWVSKKFCAEMAPYKQ